MYNSLFNWLDSSRSKKAKGINYFFPVLVCLILFIIFIGLSYLFIVYLINPSSTEKVEIDLKLKDVVVGFFLYFVTAVDYALIVGRMQITNPGSKSRFLMNVFTCIGCFVGVSLVLFLWGFVREADLIILPILIFAGSVMIKLAYENTEYFHNIHYLPKIIVNSLNNILSILNKIFHFLTFWIPELGNPKLKKMSNFELSKWAFLLPFIIGTDDLIGYMGAMTIYNVFGLLFGIYLADILIDILIFTSPKLTKQIVESPTLSLLASLAFLYLGYKSFFEAVEIIIHNKFALIIMALIALTLIAYGLFRKSKKAFFTTSVK